jgi:hypothetical protein
VTAPETEPPNSYLLAPSGAPPPACGWSVRDTETRRRLEPLLFLRERTLLARTASGMVCATQLRAPVSPVDGTVVGRVPAKPYTIFLTGIQLGSSADLTNPSGERAARPTTTARRTRPPSCSTLAPAAATLAMA